MIDTVNAIVKVAFLAAVLQYLDLHRPGTLAKLQHLPWPTIALACVSAAALYGAFRDVVGAAARGLLWLATVLACTAMTLASIGMFAVVQWGPKEKSDELIGALKAAGNATLAWF